MYFFTSHKKVPKKLYGALPDSRLVCAIATKAKLTFVGNADAHSAPYEFVRRTGDPKAN